MNGTHLVDLPTRLTPAELAAHQDDVTVLDVRTPGEFAGAHIPGSFNVPLDLLPEHAEQLRAAVGGPLVLVCRSGMRAQQAGNTLGTLELPRLHVLEGGMTAWEQAALPVNRQGSSWDMERQVRGVAGSVAMTGALAGLFIWRPLGGLAAAIGGGLLVSALTNSCTMARFLGKLPYNRGATCDVPTVLASIRTSTSGQQGVRIHQPAGK